MRRSICVKYDTASLRRVLLQPNPCFRISFHLIPSLIVENGLNSFSSHESDKKKHTQMLLNLGLLLIIYKYASIDNDSYFFVSET